MERMNLFPTKDSICLIGIVGAEQLDKFKFVQLIVSYLCEIFYSKNSAVVLCQKHRAVIDYVLEMRGIDRSR